ncbi:MAG: hypothetical protein GY853_13950 [PVC group bacterium]|nr:hypothetical protein [PVC group bacterium]
MKITTLEMECEIAKYFGIRRNTIVPNIFWSMFNYELDLLIITGSRYAYEVEIKVSLQDLKRDSEKYHTHDSPKIKKLYFAIPHYLEKHIGYIPEKAGILVVCESMYYPGTLKVRKIREAVIKSRYQWSQDEVYEANRVCAKRIWGLKEAIVYNQKQRMYERERKIMQRVDDHIDQEVMKNESN